MGREKEHGIVYTPEFITAFIVEQTLGKTLEDARAACMEGYKNTNDWRKPTAEERIGQNLATTRAGGGIAILAGMAFYIQAP